MTTAARRARTTGVAEQVAGAALSAVAGDAGPGSEDAADVFGAGAQNALEAGAGDHEVFVIAVLFLEHARDFDPLIVLRRFPGSDVDAVDDSVLEVQGVSRRFGCLGALDGGGVGIESGVLDPGEGLGVG